MGFNALRQVNLANEAGQESIFTWRKVVTQVTVARQWFDLTLSPGNPSPIYYASAPAIGAVLAKSTDGSINHGQNVSPKTKHVKRFLVMTSSATGVPMPFMLCDYLLYYPFMDQSTNDEQFMDVDRTPAALTRYTDGKGVQIMAVSTNGNSGLTPTFTVKYTNSDGVANRVTDPVGMMSATASGIILTAQTGVTASAMPFIPLQTGDTGVRSIQSMTVTVGADVGLLCLVLVKPILTGCLYEQTAPTEVVPLMTSAELPRIYDDACLSLVCNPSGSLSGVTLLGELETIFN